MLFKHKIPFIKQIDSNDCGIACVAMLSTYFGVKIGIRELKRISNVEYEGISIENLINLALEVNLKLIPLSVTKEKLDCNIPFPVIAYWNQNHFLIIEKTTSKFIYLIDPAVGKFKLAIEEFYEGWLINNTIGNFNHKEAKGILMFVEPLPHFGNINHISEKRDVSGWSFIKENFFPYKRDNIRILLGLLIISVLQLSIPFLNQLIVDVGIQYQNISFIYAIGFIIVLFFILISVNEFIRSWSLVFLGARINYKLISFFLKKITKLPISTIYSKKIGDYIERINDHKRLESFFSENIIHSLFSIVTLIVYSLLLFYFSSEVFLIVIAFTFIELLWIFRFLNSIRTIDNKVFGINSQDQEKVYEILSNLPDIKLNTLEESKNVEWKLIQKKLFKINIDKLKLNQLEKGGSKIIAAIQFSIVTVTTAKLVISGSITIGTMISILFIVSQLNYPISQLINFLLQYQEIKNSFDRILEIHELEEESNNEYESAIVPHDDIQIQNVKFGYTQSTNILDNLTLTIPSNKTTAIVGYSGSGKTTLLKLLLKFYNNYEGTISFGKSRINFNDIKANNWRNNCGAVLQESSIYSDTIAYNVSLQENSKIDENRLFNALKIACIEDFVKTLPLGIFTRLTHSGSSLSSGQKQRLLIARLVYKNPSFIFLDEATNSLDANTEQTVIKNIDRFFNGKTIMIVAHRLSTVKNADQIIVLDKGKIVERGTHKELLNSKGYYYNLIKNQLDLETERI